MKYVFENIFEHSAALCKFRVIELRVEHLFQRVSVSHVDNVPPPSLCENNWNLNAREIGLGGDADTGLLTYLSSDLEDFAEVV